MYTWAKKRNTFSCFSKTYLAFRISSKLPECKKVVIFFTSQRLTYATNILSAIHTIVLHVQFARALTYSDHKYWFNCSCSKIAIKGNIFFILLFLPLSRHLLGIHSFLLPLSQFSSLWNFPSIPVTSMLYLFYLPSLLLNNCTK